MATRSTTWRAITLIVLLCRIPTGALESDPVRVLEVESGITLKLEGTVGRQPHPVRVRLQFIHLVDDPSAEAAAIALLKQLVQQEAAVRLRTAKEKLDVAPDGTVEATVVQDPTAKNPPERRCLQAELVRSGWCRYCTDAGAADPALAELLIAAQDEARAARRGGSANLPAESSAPSKP